jgi:uncharacterized membrane protein YjgN (DUF898 family)
MSNTLTSTAVPVNQTAPTRGRQEHPIVFNATGREYFGIWIVNLLLTGLTLGIYSAWAKVRRTRYFYGSTLVNNASFEYHANPVAILKGRLIAFAVWLLFMAAQYAPAMYIVLLPAMFFAMPWVIMRARKFQLAMTSYRNVRFAFHGDYAGAFQTFILWPMLGFLSMGLAMPSANWRVPKYLFGEAAYGRERMHYMTGAAPFYRLFFSGIGMMCVLGAVGAAGMFAANMDPMAMAVLMLAVAPAYLLLLAYMQVGTLNLMYNGVEFGPVRMRAHLKTLPMAWLHFSNAIFIALTLGLYYPWAKVRQLRYVADNMSVEVNGNLDQFAAGLAPEAGSSFGGEAAELFDMDLGV